MAFIPLIPLLPALHCLSSNRLPCHSNRRVNNSILPTISAAGDAGAARIAGQQTRVKASMSGVTSELKNMELSEETKEIVKSTVPVLKKQGVAIVSQFYPLLFSRYPELKQQFNMDRQAKGKRMTEGVPAQVASLSRAVLGYASNIDNPTVLLPTVMGIAHKHVSRGVKSSQYSKIGECLIAAIGQVLGEAATPAIVDAWTQAYDYLANMFVSIEEEIRNKAAAAAGYEGFTEMQVKRIEENIGENKGKVLHLLPPTGVVPQARAGQYAAIVVMEVAGVGDSMLTATVETESATELRLTVPSNGEAANEKLLGCVEEGMKVTVGMPCGQF